MARVRIPVVAIAGNATLAGASMAIRNRDTSATIPVYAAETGATTLTLAQQVSDAFGRFPGWTDAPLPVEATITPPAGSGLAPWVEAWDAVPDDLPNITPPDGSITSAKIADGTIVAVDLADGAVTTPKVADGAITSAKIADGTIVVADIADGAITSAKILDGTIAAGDIAAGVVPKITYSSSKPTPTIDGEEWIYPADATNGILWRFRWIAARTRWELVGGNWLQIAQAVGESRPDTGAYGDTSTVGPSYTVPFSGGYRLRGRVGQVYPSNYGSNLQVGYSINGSTPSDTYAGAVLATAGGQGGDVAVPEDWWTLAAGQVAKLQYKASIQGGGGYTGWFYYRTLYVRPQYIT